MPPLTDNSNVRMIPYFDQHWYEIRLSEDDVRYFASVTTKLGLLDKPFLSKWRGDIGNREADFKMFESQTRGSRIHAAWDILQKGGEVLYDRTKQWEILPNSMTISNQDEMMDLWKLQQFFNIVKPKVIKSEFTCYHLKERYAGTIDALYYIKEGEYKGIGRNVLKLEEGYYIADLKTGKSVGDDAYRQTAAYVHAVEFLNDLKIKGALILHTGASTKSGIEGFAALHRNREEIEMDYSIFLNISRLWDLLNKDVGPKMARFPSSIKLTL